MYFFCKEVKALFMEQINFFALQCDTGKLLHMK